MSRVGRQRYFIIEVLSFISYFISLKCIVHFFYSFLQRGGRGPKARRITYISEDEPLHPSRPRRTTRSYRMFHPLRGERERRAPRRIIPCHLCPANVKNFIRYIRQVHRMQPARLAKNPQGYILLECPIAGCRKVYPRIAQHLKKYHKIKDNTDHCQPVEHCHQSG